MFTENKNKNYETMLKHFTVLELGYDAESPMVGTIDNVTNTKQGIQSFKERLIDALGEHFDSDDIHFRQEIPDMFLNIAYEDIEISVEDNTYEIRILETWIY